MSYPDFSKLFLSFLDFPWISWKTVSFPGYPGFSRFVSLILSLHLDLSCDPKVHISTALLQSYWRERTKRPASCSNISPENHSHNLQFSFFLLTTITIYYILLLTITTIIYFYLWLLIIIYYYSFSFTIICCYYSHLLSYLHYIRFTTNINHYLLQLYTTPRYHS